MLVLFSWRIHKFLYITFQWVKITKKETRIMRPLAVKKQQKQQRTNQKQQHKKKT